MSDDVSDDDSTYDTTKSDEYHTELREGGTEHTEDVRSDDYCCIEVDTTDYYFYTGKDKMK